MLRLKLIFLVDDDTLLLPAYRRRFEQEVRNMDWGEPKPPSYAIYDCTSGQAALDLMRVGLGLETTAPGTQLEYFILSDGNMPGMDGDQFIRRAREMLGERVKTALLVSGKMSEFAEGAESVGYTLLQKPVEWKVLSGYLRSFLLPDAPT